MVCLYARIHDLSCCSLEIQREENQHLISFTVRCRLLFNKDFFLSSFLSFFFAIKYRTCDKRRLWKNEERRQQTDILKQQILSGTIDSDPLGYIVYFHLKMISDGGSGIGSAEPTTWLHPLCFSLSPRSTTLLVCEFDESHGHRLVSRKVEKPSSGSHIQTFMDSSLTRSLIQVFHSNDKLSSLLVY